VQFSDYDIGCIQKAKDIIVADLSIHQNIELIATKVGFGKTKLKMGFKLYCGMGLYSFLKRQRMIKAAELLIGTDKTIKQIAKSVGFRHASNFAKSFGSYYGITPGKYRKEFSRK
jgi:AraC-like DNA-binding protein